MQLSAQASRTWCFWPSSRVSASPWLVELELSPSWRKLARRSPREEHMLGLTVRAASLVAYYQFIAVRPDEMGSKFWPRQILFLSMLVRRCVSLGMALHDCCHRRSRRSTFGSLPS
jgi:fatty acid desaturase